MIIIIATSKTLKKKKAYNTFCETDNFTLNFLNFLQLMIFFLLVFVHCSIDLNYKKGLLKSRKTERNESYLSISPIKLLVQLHNVYSLVSFEVLKLSNYNKHCKNKTV
ncbi:unnamed protein product [Heterobilharzia americana]|nr:unnamed protein product [Heterobilharzia americana]